MKIQFNYFWGFLLFGSNFDLLTHCVIFLTFFRRLLLKGKNFNLVQMHCWPFWNDKVYLHYAIFEFVLKREKMNIFCARASSRHYQISHTTQKSSKLTKTCFLHPELCSLLFTWCENNDENKFAKIIRKKNQLNFRDKIKMISKMKQKNLILGIKYEKKLEIWRQNRKKWIWILAPKMKKKIVFWRQK